MSKNGEQRPEIINLHDKRLEQSLEQSVVNISAQIADAIEMTQKAKSLSADSEAMLIQAHVGLEELYTQLDPNPVDR